MLLLSLPADDQTTFHNAVWSYDSLRLNGSKVKVWPQKVEIRSRGFCVLFVWLILYFVLYLSKFYKLIMAFVVISDRAQKQVFLTSFENVPLGQHTNIMRNVDRLSVKTSIGIIHTHVALNSLVYFELWNLLKYSQDTADVKGIVPAFSSGHKSKLWEWSSNLSTSRDLKSKKSRKAATYSCLLCCLIARRQTYDWNSHPHASVPGTCPTDRFKLTSGSAWSVVAVWPNTGLRAIHNRNRRGFNTWSGTVKATKLV